MGEGKKLIKSFTERRLGLVYDDSAPSERAVWVRPAENCSEEEVNEILALRGALLCVAMSAERAQSFLLSPMSRARINPAGAAADFSNAASMCESVEAREGVTTGISAHDRARTISILGEPTAVARKLVRPGHIFPVEARAGGVLVRQALVEGALDLVRLAGFSDAALYADALDSTGEFLDGNAQRRLCESNGAPRIALSTLTRERLVGETLIFRAAEARLPTRLAGEVHAIVYQSHIHSGEHVALIKGKVSPATPLLVRVQPEFTFGDVFGGNTPPSRKRLLSCLKLIGESGNGVLVYLRRPLSGHLQAQISSWKNSYLEKPAALMREYGLGAQILRDLGVQKAILITDSTKNLVGLTSFGIEIVGQIGLPSYPDATFEPEDSVGSTGDIPLI